MHRIPLTHKGSTRIGWLACSAAALALAICLCLAAPAASEDQLPEILPINPVPDVELVQYDAFGYLDEIRDDSVIIRDRQFGWSTTKEVRFFAEGSSVPIERSLFKAGDLVGCVLDDDRNVEELWKLKAPPPDD
jgi:hypothetical protein